jgi:hypothetical protein
MFGVVFCFELMERLEWSDRKEGRNGEEERKEGRKEGRTVRRKEGRK